MGSADEDHSEYGRLVLALVQAQAAWEADRASHGRGYADLTEHQRSVFDEYWAAWWRVNEWRRAHGWPPM